MKESGTALSIGTPTSVASFDQNVNFKFLHNPDVNMLIQNIPVLPFLSKRLRDKGVISSYFQLTMASGRYLVRKDSFLQIDIPR